MTDLTRRAFNKFLATFGIGAAVSSKLSAAPAEATEAVEATAPAWAPTAEPLHTAVESLGLNHSYDVLLRYAERDAQVMREFYSEYLGEPWEPHGMFKFHDDLSPLRQFMFAVHDSEFVERRAGTYHRSWQSRWGNVGQRLTQRSGDARLSDPHEGVTYYLDQWDLWLHETIAWDGSYYTSGTLQIPVDPRRKLSQIADNRRLAHSRYLALRTGIDSHPFLLFSPNNFRLEPSGCISCRFSEFCWSTVRTNCSVGASILSKIRKAQESQRYYGSLHALLEPFTHQPPQDLSTAVALLEQKMESNREDWMYSQRNEDRPIPYRHQTADQSVRLFPLDDRT